MLQKNQSIAMYLLFTRTDFTAKRTQFKSNRLLATKGPKSLKLRLCLLQFWGFQLLVKTFT